MDATQRGMGLDWDAAFEFIGRTRKEFPDALVFNGAVTGHLGIGAARTLDDIMRAYMLQIEAIRRIVGRFTLMVSREICRIAGGPEDYEHVHDRILPASDRPVILHWLGEMFDPQLRGYWGSENFEESLDFALGSINRNRTWVDGIKISLLDKNREIAMRRRPPSSVRMYTGDDFNYPELIAGDDRGYSHALLGAFDPLAPAAALAVSRLASGNLDRFHRILDPTVPLSRLIFRTPTRYYNTGVVFLSWLNGFRGHFIMPGGGQSMRPLLCFSDIFRLADTCGLLRDPELATRRMDRLLALYGRP